jgi:L-iditol 2-dehydrogenase
VLQEKRTLEAPLPDELQIEVHSTGICGSDQHYYNHFANGDILIREPLSLGHESSGIVTAIGSGVPADSFRVGDRVALEVGKPCEKCSLCLVGRYNICPRMSFRSSAKSFPHFQGTLQEAINAPAKWCHK